MLSNILKRQAAVFGFFMLLACLMVYWPLFHVGTHIPNDWYITDYFHFNWNYWWMRHALTTGQTIYETNYVLYPYTTNLGFHILMPFWYPVWAVFEPLWGTLGAMQVVILLGTGLTGYAAFGLLRRDGVSAGLALAGGAIYQLTPAMYAALQVSTPNYVDFFWPPVQLLVWGQLAGSVFGGHNRRAMIWAVILGLSLYGMVMTDTQFVLHTALLLVPYGLLTLWQAKTWAVRGRLVGLGLLALGVALALLWFAGPLPYMLTFDRGALVPPSADEAYSIPFPDGYLSRDVRYASVITLGWLVIPLLVASLLANIIWKPVTRDRRWFWLLVALPPLILSVGSSLTLGDTQIPMPYRWLHDALGGMLRSAHRFGMMFILPTMIFVGLTWTPVLRVRPAARWFVPVGLMLLVFGEARLFWPMPIQPVVPHYEFYERIGAEQGAPYDDEVILEVPVAAGSGEIWVGELDQLKTQFYGITHGKRMVNGLIARAPINHFWYLRTDNPLLSWLGQRRLLEPESARQELERIIYDWPVGYVVVHQDLIGREGVTVQEVIGWLNAQTDLLCPVWVEGDAVVYRTAWHPDGCPPRTPPEVEPGVYQIDIGSPGDEMFIGWGWHWPENINGLTLRWTGEYPQTQLYVDLPPGDYEISLSAQAFWEGRDLRLLLNGTPLQPGEVTVMVDGLSTYTFNAPAGLVGDGADLTLSLDYDGWVVPVEVGQSADTRKLAIAVDWVRLTRQ